MPSHAAPIPFKKRLLTAGALATSVLLMALGVSQVATAGAHAAQAAFSCDQNTLYSIDGSGNFDAINATTGAATALPTQTPSNNALGITENGTYAYATLNTTGANASGTITRYDPVNNVTDKYTAYVPANTYRGAVDPVSKIYYYAQGNTKTSAVYAFDTVTNTYIGQVGVIDYAQASTGDFAFSTTGVLYAVSGSQVVRVNGILPTTPMQAGAADFTTTQIAQLGSVTASPGIAFSTNGYLYVAVSNTVIQIDPATGASVATHTISDGTSTKITPTDLASCNYADSLQLKASVDQRWQSTDQFSLAIGGGPSYGNTATTSGTATGVQAATAGANLVVASASKPYTITQTAAGTTQLANYTTTYACSTADGTSVASGSGNTASFTLPTSSDNDVSCLFTNKLAAVHVDSSDDTYYTATDTALSNPSPGILANDAAATGLTVVGNTQPTSGTLSAIDSKTGAFTYTPNTGFAGADSFTYTTQDSSGQQSTSKVTINVGPTAGDDTGTVVVGGTLTVPAPGVLGNDGGVNLKASNASTPSHGTVQLNSDGSYTYTATDPTYSGPDSWTYTVTDGGGNTKTGTVRMTITPKAVDDTLDTIPTDSSLTWDTAKSLSNDVGTSLTVASVQKTSAHGGTVALSSDGTSFTYTPADDFSGADSFSYTVTDPTGGTASALEKITVTPIAKNDAVSAIALNTPVTIQGSDLTANDRGSNLTITGVSNATRGTAVLNGDQTITFTPATGKAGTASFQYTISDGTSQSTATVIVPVNPAAGTYTQTVNSGDTLTVAADQGVLSKDADRASETAGGASTPFHGSVTLNADGSYTYTPSTTYSGPDSFTYTVTDNASGSPTTSTGKVTITVKPQAQADKLGSVDAGASKTFQPTDLTGNDDGAHLSISSVGTAAAGTAVGGDAVLNGDGTVTFTPAAGFSGPASFQYTITDGTFSSTATDTILVTPVAVDDTLAPTTSDSPKTFDASALLGNDSGYQLSLTSVGDPSMGDVVLSSDGSTFTYTPQPGFSGTYQFSYTAEDGSSLHQPLGATATITVKPTAGSLSITTPSGVADTVPADHGLLSKDSGADGSTLSVALDTDPGHGPTGGTVALVGDAGAFTYTPSSTFSGTDSFDYVVTDASGQKSIGTVTVTVPPKANPDTVAAAPTGTTTIDGSDLLKNDAGSGVHIISVGTPADGTLTDNGDGTYTYTPSGTFSGSDTFSYTVADVHGTPSTTTVSVTVPVSATADKGSVLAGQKLTVDAAHGVLSNDHGSGLQAAILTAPAHGTVHLNADGSYDYTPADGFSGSDSFTYTATDVHGTTDTATVTLTVLPSTPASTATGLAGTPVHLDAPGVLAGAEGDRVTVTAVEGGAPGTAVTTPAGNTVTVGADGTVDFTPAKSYSGTDTITFQVTDHNGLSSTSTIAITVAPRAFGDGFTTPAGTPLAIATGDLTGNDLGTGLTITGISPALSGTTATLAHGTLTRQTDGSYVYTPNAGFSGTDTFDYTVTDASHQTATATATIIVGDKAADYSDSATSGTSVTVAATPTTGLLSKSSGTGLKIAVGRDVAHGHLVIRPDGSYTYTPDSTFSGQDSFTYSVTDDQDQVSTGTVTIDVAPLAVADSASVAAGSTLTLDATHGVLSNDHGSVLHVTSTGAPTAAGATSPVGLVSISGSGALVYTPPAGFSGVVTIPYTATDQNGVTTNGVVTVTVKPAATADAQQTIAGHALHMTAANGLLANDSGSTLRAALKSGPKHGTVVVNPDGSYTYTPARGFSGTDTFVYTATDASGQVTTATATITVLKAAVAANDHATGTPGKKVTLEPLGNDHPTAGANFAPSTVQLIDPATGRAASTVRIPGKGVFTVTDGEVAFTPLGHFTGTATVDYQVSDSDDVVVRALITVVYPTAAAIAATHADPAPVAAGTTPGALAFTGSQGVGGMLLIGLGAALMGLVLILIRRLRRPAPGPRRLGL